ncbi:MAG: baseplate J/gp47 family protein [Oscillospiraceae bacterium]
MIRLPNLDDQKYSDIVEAAKRRIPVIFPEWTDFNEHDPGITVIEVFAWLKEMQQYYLNKISDQSRADMFRLLGIEMRRTAPASVMVSFDGAAPEVVPAGTRVSTADGIEFVNPSEYTRPEFSIEKVVLENSGSAVDITDIARDPDSTFYPFGMKLFAGSRALYIGLSEGCKSAGLLFDVEDRLPVKRSRPVEGSVPPRGIVWEYSTANGYKPCVSVKDDTFALSFSGGVTLELGADFSPSDNGGRTPGLCWIRARLTDSGCEDMPQLRRIYCGGMQLVQKKRLAASEDITTDGRSPIEVRDMLAHEGRCLVFVRDEYGWDADEDAESSVNEYGAEVRLSGRVKPCADGMPNVRVVRFDEDFGRSRMFFSSDGLPCQRIEFDAGDGILCGELRLMVCDRESAEHPRWREYVYTDRLSAASPYDRCFGYDPERREILFGDNEHGEVPPAGSDNIMVFGCSVTKGFSGNVMSGNLTGLTLNGEKYRLIQDADSSGGEDTESMRHALGRVRELLNESSRAVTAQDYRAAALKTPGIRIADAAAIPFFDEQSSSVSEDKAPNSVALVVIPYSAERFPVPDERFLDAVRGYLENYRLITTKLKVISPVYVRIDISAELICGSREVMQVVRRVRSELEKKLSVYRADGRTRFGKTVSEESITGYICAVDGVLSVKNIHISADNPACSRDSYGKIAIPPNAVAYCGNVSITVAES